MINHVEQCENGEGEGNIVGQCLICCLRTTVGLHGRLGGKLPYVDINANSELMKTQ